MGRRTRHWFPAGPIRTVICADKIAVDTEHSFLRGYASSADYVVDHYNCGEEPDVVIHGAMTALGKLTEPPAGVRNLSICRDIADWIRRTLDGTNNALLVVASAAQLQTIVSELTTRCADRRPLNPVGDGHLMVVRCKNKAVLDIRHLTAKGPMPLQPPPITVSPPAISVA